MAETEQAPVNFGLAKAREILHNIETDIVSNNEALTNFQPKLDKAKEDVRVGKTHIDGNIALVEAVGDNYDNINKTVGDIADDLEASKTGIAESEQKVLGTTTEIERIAGYVPVGIAPMTTGSTYTLVNHPNSNAMDGVFDDIERARDVILTSATHDKTPSVTSSFDDGVTWETITADDFGIEGTLRKINIVSIGTEFIVGVHWEDASDFGWLRFLKGTPDVDAGTIDWVIDKDEDLPSPRPCQLFNGTNGEVLVGGLYDGFLLRKVDGAYVDNTSQLKACVKETNGDELDVQLETTGGATLCGSIQHVLVGSKNRCRLFKSVDGGLSWVFVDDLPETKGRLAGSGDYLYINCLNNGIWRSHDKGVSWYRCPIIRGMEDVSVAHLTAHHSDARIVNSRGDIAVSNDGGVNWKIVMVGPNLGLGKAKIMGIIRTTDRNIALFDKYRFAVAKLPSAGNESGDSVTTKSLKLISEDGSSFAEFVFDTSNELIVRMGDHVTTIMDGDGDFESAGNVSGHIIIDDDDDGEVLGSESE